MDAAQNTQAEISQKIENRIAARGTTRAHVYMSAGMSRQSFERSMRGPRSFTISELIAISGALGTTPAELLPSEWIPEMKQAA